MTFRLSGIQYILAVPSTRLFGNVMTLWVTRCEGGRRPKQSHVY